MPDPDRTVPIIEDWFVFSSPIGVMIMLREATPPFMSVTKTRITRLFSVFVFKRMVDLLRYCRSFKATSLSNQEYAYVRLSSGFTVSIISSPIAGFVELTTRSKLGVRASPLPTDPILITTSM